MFFEKDNLLQKIKRFLETEETKMIKFKSSSTLIILNIFLLTHYYFFLN
jgi:hypothetical protein